MRAALPDNESERLNALYAYGVLDTQPEAAFDRLTRAASRVFGAPVALVTLVDSDRQFFKSAYGIETRETPRYMAFCEHAILSGDSLIIPDATLDERFLDNPLVTGPPGIRYYVGAPLRTQDGFRLGSLCVIDTIPRPRPSQCQLDILEDLAAQVVEQLNFSRARRDLEGAMAALKTREAEFKENEERIQRSESKNALALEAGKLGVWEWDVLADRITWSAIAEEIFGLKSGFYEQSFAYFLSCVHPEDRDTIAQQATTLSRFVSSFPFHFRIIRPDDETRWICGTGSFDRSETGRLMSATALFADITDRELSLRELQSSEELFRGLSVSCPVGIYRADLDGNVTYVNPTTARIWRMVENEMHGRGWLTRVHPDDLDYLVSHWVEANGQGRNYGQEFRLVFEDGSISWISGRSAVVRDGKGQPIGTVGTVDDITDRKQFQREILEAKDAAEAANHAKDLFLANVSHELRTPLNGVLGITEVLLESPLSTTQKELAETVRDSGQTLLSVVNDILDLTSIGAGKVKLHSEPFDLRQIVSKAAALVEWQANAKGVELGVEYPGSIPDMFIGDGDRIRKVLGHFLTNAVKFTDSGKITLRVEADPPESGRTEVCLSVHDSGPGISEEAQRSLFQPFTQVDGSSTRRHGGVGLGLAISRRIAELMGGSVGVISGSGHGSTFWMRIGLAALPQEIPGGANSKVHRAPGKGAAKAAASERGRILLVEDNAINQKVAVHLLRKLGWSADVAADGSVAYELAQSNKYAAILMDCQMPYVDGYAATSMIRSYELSLPMGRTPIIAVTAHAMAGDRERCLRAGMDDYMVKPLQLRSLSNMLDHWAKEPIEVGA